MRPKYKTYPDELRDKLFIFQPKLERNKLMGINIEDQTDRKFNPLPHMVFACIRNLRIVTAESAETINKFINSTF